MSSGDGVEGESRLVSSIIVALIVAIVVGGGVWAALWVVRRPPPAGDGPTAARPAGETRPASGPDARLVAALPRLAAEHARGAAEDRRVLHGRLAASRSTRLDEPVAGGRCYAWIGRSPDRTDLDLFLRQGGVVVSQDKSPDNSPVVRHCVASAATVELEVKMFAGQGPWVVQRYAFPPSPGADQLQLLHELYARQVVKGAEPLWPLRRITLREKQTAPVKLPLDPEWCYVAVAVSQPGTDVDLSLLDPEERVVEEDRAPDNWPTLRHCPDDAATFKLRLVMFAGNSEVAFRVYRDERAR